MTPAEKKQIKQKIESEISETEEDILSLEERVKPVSPDSAIGRLSRMDAIGNLNINKASLSQAKQKLIQLKAALERIDDPEFGICRECEEPIPLGRILIMPGSILCVRCAQ